MLIYLVSLLIFNGFVGFIIYKKLYRKRKLYTDRFGMIMAMSSSGILSLSISIIFQFLFPHHFSLPIIITVIIAGILGVTFGSLVKFQTLLAGFSHGVLGSLMGNMLGAVVKDPSICSLPAYYLNSIEQNMYIISLFGTLLVLVTISLVYYSFRI